MGKKITEELEELIDYCYSYIRGYEGKPSEPDTLPMGYEDGKADKEAGVLPQCASDCEPYYKIAHGEILTSINYFYLMDSKHSGIYLLGRHELDEPRDYVSHFEMNRHSPNYEWDWKPIK